ncbi:hypothetical protein V473_22820 [Sphingobium cupriresistens LL01]|uniref:Uncharacterized protein n=1 Tax=Sphingobium cupriresistens LL01 TaxID=1420583 RepID=A0A0J7XKZ3_9SPHN|nr:hypothetical protein V473_22820 [Sphingobium cupriresistens LL01]
MICSSLNLVFLTSVSSRRRTLAQTGRVSGEHVSSAYGEDGFLGRWTGYARDGHGGNIGLKSRELSDYQVSILEVCGSGLTVDEIIRVEALWKAKLQSREMGLNKN